MAAQLAQVPLFLQDLLQAFEQRLAKHHVRQASGWVRDAQQRREFAFRPSDRNGAVPPRRMPARLRGIDQLSQFLRQFAVALLGLVRC